MRNLKDEDDDHDYSPNELADLQYWNRRKYEEIVNSNLEEGDTIEEWQERNRKHAQRHLNQNRNEDNSY